MSIKNERPYSVQREFVTIASQTDYDITGIETGSASFLYKEDGGIYEYIPTGYYTIVTSGEQLTLRITSDRLLETMESIQVVYEVTDGSIKYEPPGATNPEVLKDRYNELVDAFKDFKDYTEKHLLINDSERQTKVMVALKDGEMIAYDETNDKYYGVHKDSFEKIWDLLTFMGDITVQEAEDKPIEELRAGYSYRMLDSGTIDRDGNQLDVSENDIISWSQEGYFINLGELQNPDVYDRLDEVEEQIQNLTVPNIINLKLMNNLQIGDSVTVKGYYEPSDNSQHYRIISDNDDGSGEELENGLWANIKHSGTINPKWFGARGDGVTNDTYAFKKVSDYIMANQGVAVLEIPEGTYIGGLQTIDASAGTPYYNNVSPAMIHLDYIDGLIINNAGTFVTDPNMRFGSFDPVTGERYDPSGGGFTDTTYRASGLTGVRIMYSKNVEVNNFHYDGNMDNIVIGGYWGDTGYQIASDGVYVYESVNITINSCTSYNACRDGFYVGVSSSNIGLKMNVTFNDCLSEFAARQGMSWTGGDYVYCNRCAFNNTGMGVLYSAPRAGLDIEHNGSSTKYGFFNDCQFLNNAGSDILVLYGWHELYFNNCITAGNSRGLWVENGWSEVEKPKARFENCKFHSNIAWANRGGSGVPGDVKYENCLFSNEEFGGYQNTSFKLIENLGATEVFKNCTVYDNRIDNSSDAGEMYITNGTWEDSDFVVAFQTPVNGRVGVFSAINLRNCTFRDEINYGEEDPTNYVPHFTDGISVLDYHNLKGYCRIEGQLRMTNSSGANNVDLAKYYRESANQYEKEVVYENDIEGDYMDITIPESGNSWLSVYVNSRSYANFSISWRGTSASSGHDFMKLSSIEEYGGIDIVQVGNLSVLRITRTTYASEGETVRISIRTNQPSHEYLGTVDLDSQYKSNF